MNKDLIGRWSNDYGSILEFESQGRTGALRGVYTSETGASGTYLMNGWSPDVELTNQPVSISVFWKPTDSTEVDSSWNWVSMMSGVLFLDTPDSQPVIRLLHGMVASTPMQAVQVLRAGVYTELLTFRKVAGAQTGPAISRDCRALERDTITMTNVDPSSQYKSATFLYEGDGTCRGSIVVGRGQECLLQGFIDPAPLGDFQSLSLNGMNLADRTSTFGLGGFVDLKRSVATLNLFESAAVTYSNKYTAVIVSQERFVAAITKP